jgi:hypothetical protein
VARRQSGEDPRGQSKWRLANPDKSRRATRAYREANREKVRAQQRLYRAATRARAKEGGASDARDAGAETAQ